MSNAQEPVHLSGDANFRKGACHGAQWFLETSQTLAAQGRSAEEIGEYLTELCGVLADWRSGLVALPDGNPWDWSFKDLASVIGEGRDE